MNNDELKQFKDSMNDRQREMLKELGEAFSKQTWKEKFDKTDWGQLRHKTDPELAKMQSEVPVDSPQYIMLTQEWNRRATVEQIKSVRFTAIVTAVASIIAALLGAWVGATLTKNQQQMPQPPPIIRSYMPPAESKDVNQSIKKTESQPTEKKRE